MPGHYFTPHRSVDSEANRTAPQDNSGRRNIPITESIQEPSYEESVALSFFSFFEITGGRGSPLGINAIDTELTQ